MALTEIVPARRGDAAALARLSRRLVEAGLAPAWTEQRIERARLQDDSRVFVARRGQGLVGGAVLDFEDRAAHLGLLVVETPLQRTGLGRQLLQACETAARFAGLERLALEVREHNASALAFYRACGFTDVGRRRGYYSDLEDAVVLERALR